MPTQNQAIVDAYEALQKHWRAFPKGHTESLSNSPDAALLKKKALEDYKAWAHEVRDEHLKGNHDLLFHPADLDAIHAIFGQPGAFNYERLRKEMYGGHWPNVPQHYKGNPLTARVIGVLMNPGRDDEFQDDYPMPLGDEWHKNSNIERITEQGKILASLRHDNCSWDGWFDKHKLLGNQEKADGALGKKTGERRKKILQSEQYLFDEDGRGVEFTRDCFFEIEQFPYQTPDFPWIDRELGKYERKFKSRGLRSIKLGDDLLLALAKDTLDHLDDERHKRLFILRGTAARNYYLMQKEEFAKLSKLGLVFTFSNPRTRTISPNNLVRFKPWILGSQGTPKTDLKLGKLWLEEHDKYAFINQPFKTKPE